MGASVLSHFLKLGAGSMPSREGKGGEGCGAAGWFPIVTPLVLNMGGLFVDCGLFGNWGGSGLDFLPIAASYEDGSESGCSSFMAAIRARMDIGGAGASSLMIDALNRYYARNS